jgi:hypothetical protein
VHRLAWLLAVLTAAGVTACTPSAKQVVITKTSTATSTIDMRPVDTGPVKATTATRCPVIDRQFAADTVGMRLAKITVLRSTGKLVGCRIYALQNSPLAVSEKLPPANQPAVEITFTRYRSAAAAHNAIVVAANKGTNPQQAAFGKTTGVCFQLDFYKKDHGRDWSCAYSSGDTLVQVKTVVVSPALNAILLTRRVSTP